MVKAKSKTNPNKANQHVPDPRQALFISNYFDPKSNTFANGLQSAIKAGYTKEYGLVLVSNMPTWLSESVKDNELIAKAEKNLSKFLDSDYKDPRIQADMTKFALERLNKKKYAARKELTDGDGKPLAAILTLIEDGD